MKKRIIAIALVLVLAVSLLPMGALADGGIYVSVGGKDFTAIDQTIKVGGGTAKLTWEYGGNPNLTLTNVKLTQFADIGSADGMHAYAGIVYSGDTLLYINCYNCSITAPKHGENELYEGIYAEGAVSVSGDLNINNVTVGAMCDKFTVGDGKQTISSVGGCAIYASTVTVGGGTTVLNTVGTNAIICDYFSSYGGVFYITPSNGTLTVNLRTDPAYGYETAAAILCAKSASLNTAVTVNVTADYSGYTGDEPVLVAGVYAQERVDLFLRAAVNMNVKCSENVAVENVAANYVRCDGQEISLRTDLSGGHLGATAIDTVSLDARQKIKIVMNGTQPDDTGIYAEKVDDYLVMDEVYVDLDCPDAVAVRLPRNCKFVNDVMSDNIINIHLPKGGDMINITEDSGENTFCTVVDADGKPASTIVLNRLPYVFNDIGGKGIDPYRKAILWANDVGITTGFTLVEFRPAAACNRGQVVTFLWRAKGSPEPTLTENPFVDVYESSPYYKAILWAVEQGITNGFDATHFKPSNPCTRAQVVTFLWRTDGKPAPESAVNPFADVSASGSTQPYYDAILWASENGITGGYTPTEFRPNATCNRGQVVTFIYRDMVERVVGGIADVKVEVNPADPANNPVKIYFRNQYDEKYVPVNVTAKYGDGSEKTVGILLAYDNNKSELPVPENLVEVVGYGTTQDTVTLKVNCNNGTRLLNVNFDENTARTAVKSLPEAYTLTDRYFVYQTDVYSLRAYDMNKDILMEVMLNFSTVCNVHDYCVIGNTVYVRENVYHRTVRVYKADLTNVVDTASQRGYQTYLTEIDTYSNVKDLTFDETGYTVVSIENGADVSRHYS